ncbi:hypothetical protein ABH935_008587 [Catenulispora sp. GAS73]|uniref:hypothetical protein n=1 Tax=Catenulispora sp. GAS73 TaxID=3156269 RepID=UPI003518C601
MAARASAKRRQPEPTAPERLMLAALQNTHQHADAKAGVLVAVQGMIIATAGAWNRQALEAWERGGLPGTVSAALLVLFALGLSGGASCVTLALWPRLLQPAGPNRFSFVDLARGAAGPAPWSLSPTPATDPVADRAAEHLELVETVRFLAGVAVIKYRSLMGAVLFTALMGLSGSLLLVLQPILL